MRGYQGTRETYDGNIKIIFAKYELNEKANATISIIQSEMKQKKLTDEGKECMEEILTKLYYEMSTFLINSNPHNSVLPLFK